jgi:hypothetical protein
LVGKRCGKLVEKNRKKPGRVINRAGFMGFLEKPPEMNGLWIKATVKRPEVKVRAWENPINMRARGQIPFAF